MKERLKSLQGLKAIAVLFIFYWHCPARLSSAGDIGARACEFFFVASGFTIAYSYLRGSKLSTLRETADYTKKKIISIYPLYFLTFLMCVKKWNLVPTQKHIRMMIMNLTMTQAWDSDTSISMSFNGVAWFVSCLMFCYLMTFIFFRVIRAGGKEHHLQNSIILGIGLLAIRIAFEQLKLNHVMFSSISFHTFPIVRCLEYGVGITAGVIFMEIKDRLSSVNKDSVSYRLVFSILEVAVSVLVVALCIFKCDEWSRGILYYILGTSYYGFCL